MKIKSYDWIILFLASVSAVTRFIMAKYNFEYVDYFIAIVNLIGLDYILTSILNNIKESIFAKIESSDFIKVEKINKKTRYKHVLYKCIFIIIIYNVLHILFFPNSVFNDALSMIVLGISLTDTSITCFIIEKINI